MKANDGPKGPQHDRTMRLWDRTLLWLNRYLAFDVHPRPQARQNAERFESAPAQPQEMSPPPDAAEKPKAAPVALHLSLPETLTPDPIPTFNIGDRISDTYEVKHVLGASDFSTVYLAHHRYWNLDLVIKVPTPPVVADAEALRNVSVRAEQWVAIGQHPHIASCYSVEQLNGVPLRIIEYVSGGSLRTWIEGNRSADSRVVLELADQICAALDHAHSRGFVHGFLTPENILLTQEGQPKVTDFGLRATPHAGRQRTPAPVTGAGAADVRTASLTERVLARVHPYVAPERWQNPQVVDVQTDIFALGVCLYEMLSGARPYDETTGSPREPVDVAGASDLAAAASVVLRRCVAWPREQRLHGMGEVREELRKIYQALFGRPTEAEAAQFVDADECNNKGVSYFYAGKEAAADAAWKSALDADPTHVEATFNRAVTGWWRGALTDEGLLKQLEGLDGSRDEEQWKIEYLLALVHLERGDVDSALGLLEELEKTARQCPGAMEIETTLKSARLSSRAAAKGSRVLGTHEQYVSSVCVSADGQLALSASHDFTAALWEVPTGRRLRVFHGHSAPLSCGFLSADGRWALTAADDHTMRLWDCNTGLCQRVFEMAAGRIASACLSADARLLLWAASRSSEAIEKVTLELWDAQSGRCLHVLEGHGSAVKSVCLASHGRWALTGSDDQTMRLWDVVSGQCQRVFEGHRHFVSAVCLSVDGSLALSGSWDQTLRLWDVHTGRCLRTFEGHEALITSACLSADSHWALSGSWDRTLRLWEVATGRCVRTFQGHTSWVTAVTLAADSRCALSGSWDCTVRQWNLPGELKEFCHLRLSEARGVEARV